MPAGSFGSTGNRCSMSPDKNAVSRVEAAMIQERLQRHEIDEQYAIAIFILRCASMASDLRKLSEPRPENLRFSDEGHANGDEAAGFLADRIKREFRKTFGGEMLPWERDGEGGE